MSAAILGAVIAGASVYLLALPSFAESVLSFVFDKIDNIRLGSHYSAFAIMFLPVILFGVYSPFAIRLVLRTAQRSGTVSGAVYGVSTAGSIVGTLGTTFFLIPVIGTRAITLLLGVAGHASYSADAGARNFFVALPRARAIGLGSRRHRPSLRPRRSTQRTTSTSPRRQGIGPVCFEKESRNGRPIPIVECAFTEPPSCSGTRLLINPRHRWEYPPPPGPEPGPPPSK